MATRRKGNGNSRRSSKTQRGGNGRRSDAIVLLEADHRQVEGWFEQFKKSRLRAKKAELAESIGDALRIHSQIEEEIFYPAVLEATGEQDVRHEELGERLRERKVFVSIRGSAIRVSPHVYNDQADIEALIGALGG